MDDRARRSTDIGGHLLRPDIAASWHRSSLAGLERVGSLTNIATAPIDPQSTLLRIAAPVLEAMENSLEGSMFSTVLVDRDCRVIRRWFDDKRVEESFDALNLTRGASLLEETIGTNALGTVMELRRGVTINGGEHYVSELRSFSCYGHPIRNPLTKRIDGVLDVSAMAERTNPLLRPLVSRAVEDIEARLLDSSRVSEKELLAAFQTAARHRRPVVAIGDDLHLSNQAASDLLSANDIALLRVLVEEPLRRDRVTHGLTLESGRPVTVEISRLPDGRSGALIRIEPGEISGSTAGHPTARSSDAVTSITLVSGQPGTGRTTRARELAGDRPIRFLRPAAALLEGSSSWARDFITAIERRTQVVCVDGIDLLPDDLLDLIIDSLAERTGVEVILTSGPADDLSGRAAALAGMSTARDTLVPLSDRRAEIPRLAAAMLKSVDERGLLHLTPAAVSALAAHPWPGNLRELRAVIEHAAARHSAGGLGVDDLPVPYREVAPSRELPALDRAERDVIVAALRRADGNKVRAAQELGVSRTTLYTRMRTFKITTY
ncbi:sigma-54-dependent Fis family transcriptional regulator [Gordonia soli]|uniref:Putative Fis family transcriptional regulator n=1 Tax=Gordonia soli NBRC 108243 TaxID=1223545 RepID=M0QH00_9ACTN|nr:helix-turn-helix domain-containing protein [Gordonia soli]GAC67885.1 putative Fis family transcriptional regulator [Gordonia soli NBRC 108243]